MGEKFKSVILLGILGIFIFLVVFFALNFISNNVDNEILSLVVDFLNQNIWFILVIFGVMILGNLFEVFIFPFNLVYPLINGAGAVLWVELIFRVFGLLDSILTEDIASAFAPFYSWAVFIIFLIVIFFGYLHIILDLNMRKAVDRRKREEGQVEWVDVGDEFRHAFYNLAGAIKRKFAPSRTPRIKKKAVKKKAVASKPPEIKKKVVKSPPKKKVKKKVEIPEY